jgi:hypothetical protein
VFKYQLWQLKHIFVLGLLNQIRLDGPSPDPPAQHITRVARS